MKPVLAAEDHIPVGAYSVFVYKLLFFKQMSPHTPSVRP